MDSFSNKSCLTISTDRTVNINLTDIVLQNLIDVFKAWSSIKESQDEVKDSLFDQIDNYQTKDFNKFSVDNVMFRKKQANRFTELEKTDNLAESTNDFDSPVSVVNLTGINFKVHKVEEEEEVKEVFIGGNIKEPEKVYQPIRVEFEDGYLPINRLELSKLRSG